MPITVLLADDNVLFRDGVAQILRADGRFDVVGQASRGEEAVFAAANLQPDLILMDLRMPGMSGVEAIRAIHADRPDVPIGVLTMFETREYVQSALNAGASGYLLKDSSSAELCDSAEALARGKRDLAAISPLPPVRATASTASQILALLTEREIEVLRALVTEATHEAIAKRLGISRNTLRNHISSTYHKLGIHDRAQAVIVAVREGLVDLDTL